jgi:hypothetical protein
MRMRSPKVERNRSDSTCRMSVEKAAQVTSFPIDCPTCDTDLLLPACAKPSDCGGNRCRPLAASVAVLGSGPRKFCAGHSDQFIDSFYDIVVSARRSVDIAMLQPAADARFLAALRNAITRLAYSGQAVAIRAIVGDYPPAGFDAAALLSELSVTPSLRQAPGSGSTLEQFDPATAARTAAVCPGTSQKLSPSTTGQRLSAGTTSGPRITWRTPGRRHLDDRRGPATQDAHSFVAALWGSVCSRRSSDGVNTHFAFIGARSRAGENLKNTDLPDQA